MTVSLKTTISRRCRASEDNIFAANDTAEDAEKSYDEETCHFKNTLVFIVFHPHV